MFVNRSSFLQDETNWGHLLKNYLNEAKNYVQTI